MLKKLMTRIANPIRVGLVGAGAMGKGDKLPILKRDIAKDEPVRYDGGEFPVIKFLNLLKRQSELG